MPGDKHDQIVAAIELLAEDAGGSLDKKPNVADVEAQIGADITAAERDEAWASYRAAQDAPSVANDEPPEPDAADAPDDEPDEPAPARTVETTAITNRHTGPLAINGVLIGPGEAGDVPRFDGSRGALKAWLDAGIIEAG